MRLLKMVAGIGLVALLLSAGLIPVPGGIHAGAAYAGGSRLSDPARTGDANPTAGDPDGPTGDVGPPTNGTVTEQPAANPTPAKRLGAWAHWKLALTTWLRFTYVR
jgi:hypothetical protein